MIEFSEAFKKKEQQREAVNFSALPLEKEKIDQSQFRPGLSDQAQQAKGIYQEGLSLASNIVSSAVITDEERVRDIVKKIINFTKVSNHELIELSFSKNGSEVSYQAFNLLNVCILSVQLGLAMQLDDSDVFVLATSAFLHDMGILRYRELIHQGRKLTDEEYEEIKKHPRLGQAMISQSGFGHMAQIAEVIAQEHERLDGSGYPEGCSKEAITEFAKIIGFIDVYEALTHKRPWRQAYDPLEAIKIILNSKQCFDKRLLKLFLENIGLYPKGSLVELNTKEIAQVLSHNPSYPMAPSIRIVYDAQGKKLSQPRELDLSKKATIYIVKCL